MWSTVSLGTGRVGPWVLARESGCGHEGGVRKWAWPLYDAGRLSGRGCGLVMAASWPWLRGLHVFQVPSFCLFSSSISFLSFFSMCVSRCSLLSYACFAPCLFQLLLVNFYVYNAQIKTFWICHIGHLGRRTVKEEKSSKRTASHSLTNWKGSEKKKKKRASLE